jgi:glycosyltransferase involved in cell wall biosynthesis
MVHQLSGEGWTCHVAVPGPPRLAVEYAEAGATLHIVAMRRLTTSAGAGYWVRYALGWPLAVLRLFIVARRCRASVVHSNSLHSWYGWACAALARRPHVWHAREIVTQSRAALRVERTLTRRWAVRVIAVSEAVANQLDAADVEVVTDEPDPEIWFPGRAGHWRKGMAIDDDALVLGSVARIDTWKGFDVLLDAVPLIRASFPDVVVVVAGAAVEGKEAYAADLARRAGDLGVQWLGGRRDIPDLMADLDLFVQVSSTPEPWGMVHAEALASGVAIVAGDEGGPVEILAGASPRAGVLVGPRDAQAVAAAAIGLLERAPAGLAARQARPRLRLVDTAGRFGEIFDQVASCR